MVKYALVAVLSGCALDGQGTSADAARPLEEQLEKALTEGRMDAARSVAAKLLAQPAADADILLRAGGRLAENELYQEAAQLFIRCRKEHPQSFEASYNLALADYALGKYGEAIAALDGAFISGKQQELAREYLRGKLWDALGQPGKAERSLAAAFDGAPQQENYALDLGLVYIRKRAYPEAIATFERAVKLNPRSPFLLLGLALSQALGSTYSAAIETCGRLLGIDSSFAPARLLLAYAYYMDGQLEKCQQAAAAGLAGPNPHPYLYYVHAAVLLKLNSTDYDRMLRDLDTAERAIPGCALCYLASSKVHEALGDDKAAVADLEALVNRADPSFSQAWYRLASLYQRQGDKAKSDAALARFRAIKSEQADRDAELLRNQFLRDGALAGSPGAAK